MSSEATFRVFLCCTAVSDRHGQLNGKWHTVWVLWEIIFAIVMNMRLPNTLLFYRRSNDDLRQANRLQCKP